MKLPFNLKENPKLVKVFLIFIGICFLVVLIFLISSFCEKLLFSRGQSFLVEPVFNSIKKEFHESDSEYPMVVGDSFVSWQELDQTIEFEKLLWKNGPLDWQLKGLVLVIQKDFF